MSDEEMLTPQEIADRLKVHVRTVYRWIKTDKIEAQRLPGRGAHGVAYRITEEALENFLGQKGG